MVPIATYVFLDLETSGLPVEETNRTKITELSMVAVKRQHLLQTRIGAAPRVQNKLTMCFNPCRLVQPGSTSTTGLCNDLLENETRFDENSFKVINSFLDILTKPVCLIAQNGHNFDFPILKNHLQKISMNFSNDVLVADCLHAFYDILEILKSPNSCSEVVKKEEKEDASKKELSLTDRMKTKQSKIIDETGLLNDNTLSMKILNENTPKQQIIKNNEKARTVERQKLSKVRRRFPWSEGSKPTKSFKLKNIYERVLSRPCIEAHRAENDCIMALEVSVALGEEFVKWVDKNHCLFSDVKPMTIGVRLGE